MELTAGFIWILASLPLVMPLSKLKVNKDEYLVFQAGNVFRIVTFDNQRVIGVDVVKTGRLLRCAFLKTQNPSPGSRGLTNEHQNDVKATTLESLFGKYYRR